MHEVTMRAFARAFCDALTLREPQLIAPFLDEQIDWISGRQLSLRLAQFVQFAGGKLISLRMIFDSFDAAQQMLGRTIDLSNAA